MLIFEKQSNIDLITTLKFNLTTTFTLINSFACFFYKNLLTLLVSKLPSLKDGSF